jgi:hypothetical protein
MESRQSHKNTTLGISGCCVAKTLQEEEHVNICISNMWKHLEIDKGVHVS